MKRSRTARVRILDQQFETMLNDGGIERIVERYGMPFQQPFDE